MRQLLTWSAACAALVLIGWLTDQGQQKLRADKPLLPMTFAHADHRVVNCVDCHHNFIDDSGQGLCLDCHKTDPTVSALIESQFHDLCRDCHVEQQHLGEDGGPVRSCLACHTADEAP